MRPTAGELATTLALVPHPEGGWFRETYRAVETVATTRGMRAASTAILFLVTASAPSRFHRLASDELWVFQGGLPLELVTLVPQGAARLRVLGDPALSPATVPQALVSAGVWQAARVAGGAAETGDECAAGQEEEAAGGAGEKERAWSLVSCIVTPGFVFDDFRLGERDELVRRFPQQADLIAALT